MEDNEIIRGINQSFLKLLNQKAYEEISVQEIAQEAFISRATFYIYFKNKDAILVGLLDDFLNEFDLLQKENTDFLNHVDMTDPTSIKNILYPNTFKIIQYFYENKNLITVLIGSNSNINFMRVLQQVYYNHFINALPQMFYKELSSDILEYYALFMTNGVAAIVESWINEGFKTSVEIISNKILNILASSLQSIYTDL